MQDQVAQLDRLHWLLADTTRLVSAVGRVEGNTAAKSTLQVCILLSRQILTNPTYPVLKIQIMQAAWLYMCNGKLLTCICVLVFGRTI